MMSENQKSFLRRLNLFFKWCPEKAELNDYEMVKEELHTEFKGVLGVC